MPGDGLCAADGLALQVQCLNVIGHLFAAVSLGRPLLIPYPWQFRVPDRKIPAKYDSFRCFVAWLRVIAHCKFIDTPPDLYSELA